MCVWVYVLNACTREEKGIRCPPLAHSIFLRQGLSSRFFGFTVSHEVPVMLLSLRPSELR